jgi:hypothetical protein
MSEMPAVNSPRANAAGITGIGLAILFLIIHGCGNAWSEVLSKGTGTQILMCGM